MTFRYEATGLPSLSRPLNPCSNDQLSTERFLHLRGQCHGGRFGLVDPGLGGRGSRVGFAHRWLVRGEITLYEAKH